MTTRDQIPSTGKIIMPVQPGRVSSVQPGYNPTMSTDDKAKNKGQELIGHGKEALGKATDDKSLETEGKGDQASGNLKQAGEKVKDAFK